MMAMGYGSFWRVCTTKSSHDHVLWCASPFATAGDSRVRWSEDKFFAPGMQEKNSEGTLILNKILLSVLIQRKTLNMNGGEIILHLQITVAYRSAHQNFKEYIKNVLLLFPKVEKPLKKPWLYSFKRSDFYMHNILLIFSL